MEKYKVDFTNFLTTVFQITTESKHEIKGQSLKSVKKILWSTEVKISTKP